MMSGYDPIEWNGQRYHIAPLYSINDRDFSALSLGRTQEDADRRQGKIIRAKRAQEWQLHPLAWYLMQLGDS